MRTSGHAGRRWLAVGSIAAMTAVAMLHGPAAAGALLAETYPPCTVEGTSGKDVIEGTGGDDVLCGLGGDDTIYGNNGDDIILGGRGHDALYGGNGDDTLVGEVGGDRLEGRGGNDELDMDDDVEGNDAAGGGSGTDGCTKDPKDWCGQDGYSAGGSISVIDDELEASMPYSWRPGCPVGFPDLRYLELNLWDFDMRVRRGELVVHESEAHNVLDALRAAWEARFPIAKMVLVDEYGADDLSMAANNTSAFNCRYVSGTTTWSQHAYGKAIDINPIQNPYLKTDGSVVPPAGEQYLDRSDVRKGMIIGGDEVVEGFEAVGWKWGGYWTASKDYQHFSWNGK